MGDSVAFTWPYPGCCSLCCSGERLCSGDSAHKRAAGQWASQWRAPVERATMAVHAGNWAGWYKGMKPSLRPWRTSIQKRGFVCSLSICRFPWEKTIQTDLKKRILPYASTPYVTLIEGLIHSLIMDVYAIIPLCQHVYSIKTGHKTKKVDDRLSLVLDGQCWEVLFKDLLLDRQDLCNRWVMCFARGGKKTAATLVKFIYSSRILLPWLIKTAPATRDHNFEIAMNQNRESDLFWTISHLNQNRESDPFFNQKKSPTLAQSPVCELAHQIRHCSPATVHWESALQGKL